jgi:ParB family chromosome partitioning protein
MGHARALLSLTSLEQERLASEVAAKALSVRQTEALVRQRQQRALEGGSAVATRSRPPAKDPDTLRLEQELSDRIGAPVSIAHGNGGRGQLVISYTSLDELEGILRHLR